MRTPSSQELELLQNHKNRLQYLSHNDWMLLLDRAKPVIFKKGEVLVQQDLRPVADNGRGIRKTRLSHIVDGAPDAGVGLAGMRERVRELGGSLEVRSNGKGTTVTITVPLNNPASRNSMENGKIVQTSPVS